MKVLASLVALALLGCARLPPGGGGPAGKRIVLTMTLDAELNQNFVYIFPLRVSNDVAPVGDGPTPVVRPPWGNGFVAGNVTHFVRYDPAVTRPFVLYRVNDPPDNLSYSEIGELEVFDEIPIDDPGNDGQIERKRFRFEIELNDLAATPADAALLETVQVNFLTMERLGSGPSDRQWDALGNGALPSELKSWVTISLRSAAVYDNQRFNFLEPQSSDVADPSLDLRNWIVEIRLQ